MKTFFAVAAFAVLSMSACAPAHDSAGPLPSSASPDPEPPLVVFASPTPSPSATPVAVSTPTPTATPVPRVRVEPSHPQAPVHSAGRPAGLPTVHPAGHPAGHPRTAAEAKRTLPDSYYKAAVWPQNEKTDRWTEVTIQEIRRDLSDLEKADDVDDFCPDYEHASTRLREICWLRLVGGVTYYESAFEPSHTYREPEGELSVGLLQLSAGNCRFANRTVENNDLLNSTLNLQCGVQIMARLIASDNALAGPFFARGASQYWSTLRAPYEFLGLRLGHKSDVALYSQGYAGY